MNFATLSRMAALAMSGALAPADALAEEPTRMTMDEAIHRALEQNPTFLVARDEIRRAQALVEQGARAGTPLTLYGTGTYLRLDHDRTLNGVVTQPKSQLNLSATLSVPLVNPRAWAQWSHSGDNVDVSKASALDTRRILGVATGHAYLEVFAQKRVLEANIRARDTAKAHYDFAHSRYAGGVGNRLDEVRAAQQLSTDETFVQSSYATIERAQEALSVLVGLDAPVDSAEEPSFAEAPPPPTAIEEASKKRADVVASERRKEAAAHMTRDNWTDYSPYLSGIFEPFYQNPPTSQLPANGWQAELVLSGSVLRRRPSVYGPGRRSARPARKKPRTRFPERFGKPSPMFAPHPRPCGEPRSRSFKRAMRHAWPRRR